MRYYTSIPANNRCGLCCTKINNFKVIKGSEVILHDVNIHIHCGELTAIIGPNGAGKSTLFKAILGEIPHTGEINYLDAKNVRTGHPCIGYVPQQLDFDGDSPVSVMDLFCASRAKRPVFLGHQKKIRNDIKESLSKVRADNLIDRRLGELSGGELQRVLLALAIEPVPDLLLLDEPVSGVDVRGMELFYSILADLRKGYDMSIILISHDLPIVERYADRIILLNKTVMTSGKPNEVYKSKEFFDIFGYNN